MAFLVKIIFLWHSLLFLVSPSSGHADENKMEEYRLKATLVMNFGRFTEWPENTFAPDDKFRLCLIAREDIMTTFQETLAEKKIHNHPIEIVSIPYPPYGTQARPLCHLAFITDIDHRKVPQALGDWREQPVLTIGEINTFMSADGIIQLEKRDNKVAFKVNIAKAKANKLHLSALLLRHALNLKAPKSEKKTN